MVSIHASAEAARLPYRPFPWDQDQIALASYRRGFQVALGLIWLLDAALQFQPYMFTRVFVRQALASAAAGNPGIIAHPITLASNVMAQHIVVGNAIFAIIQLALACGLFWRRTVEVALGASIVWSISVWWLGEGLGGVFTEGASVYMGAPGAVILYALIALLLWPRDDESAPGSVALHGFLGSSIPRVLWSTLWGSFVYFILQPGDRAPNSLSALVSGMISGEPGWIRSIDHTLASVLANHGAEVSIVAALFCAVIAISPFLPRITRLGVVAAIAFGAGIWLVEDFGGILTGHATDPNSGILLIFLAVIFWPFHTAGRHSTDNSRQIRSRNPSLRLSEGLGFRSSGSLASCPSLKESGRDRGMSTDEP